MFHTTLRPDAANAQVARRFVCDALTSLRCDELRDTASLLTSEIVTNAIVHAGTPIDLRVSSPSPGRIRVEVDDDDVTSPVTRTSAPDNESGRGIALLDRLAAAWGVDGDQPGRSGKTVWFELA